MLSTDLDKAVEIFGREPPYSDNDMLINPKDRRDALIVLTRAPLLADDLVKKLGLPQTLDGLEKLTEATERGAQALEQQRGSSSGINRRHFGFSLLGFLGSACAGLYLTPNDRYYFNDGPSFEAHLRSTGKAAIEPGKDWVTISGDTPITAMAEGRVTYADYLSHGTKYYIEVHRLGGRVITYGQLTRKFVSKGDFVGRMNIIGTGGDITANSVNSPRHIHVNDFIHEELFDLLENNKPSAEHGYNRPVKRLDPEKNGTNGYGLKLWNGQDLWSESKAKVDGMIRYLDLLTSKASSRFRDTLNRWFSENPLGYHEINKFIIFQRALRRDAPWLTAEEKKIVAGMIKEYVNLRQPFTLPFVNPELDKIPGLYKYGGTAKTPEEFARQYQETMQLLKSKR